MKLSIPKPALAIGGIVAACTAFADNEIHPVENVLVFAHPLSDKGVAQANVVLEGEALQRSLAVNLGATLAKQAGIHSAAFGEAVGRPVIHGLSGPRVRIMEDRIDTLDVSVTSGDHAVGVEPFVAERIEVLKGASSILYGSGAIGGVVNVHTGRIPQQLSDAAISGGFEVRRNNNNQGNTTALKLNGGYKKFAWHIDDTRKHGDNYRIPGFATSAAQRELTPVANPNTQVSGSLPGSNFDSEASAVGASYIGERSLIGVAFSTIAADYGLPGDHGGSTDTPQLVLEQDRVDVEWQLDEPFANFSSLNVRLGVNDYAHQEVEPDGEVASVFDNKAWELRTELRYDSDNWTTVTGVQHTGRQFSAVGEEAFIAPVDTRDSGVFIVAERAFNGFDIETGLRVGTVEHEPLLATNKQFTSYSASLGVVLPLTDSTTLSFSADRSSRAPVAEELFSDGPHLVTNSFERGNEALDNENASNLSATFTYRSEQQFLTVTAYSTDFDDFIFQSNSGLIEDGLPVFVYEQADARFYGVDLNAGLGLIDNGDRSLQLTAVFDYVNAKLTRGSNRQLPRTPPMRFGVGLEGHWGGASAAVDYLHVSTQSDVADGELATPSYSDVTVHADYSVPVSDTTSVVMFLQAKNLSDQEQRIHTSFIKEFAPATGRTVELGVRLLF